MSNSKTPTTTISMGLILKETGLLKESLRHFLMLCCGVLLLVLTILSYYQRTSYSNTLIGFIETTAPAFVLLFLIIYYSGEQVLLLKAPVLWAILRGKIDVYEDELVSKEYGYGNVDYVESSSDSPRCYLLTGTQTISKASTSVSMKINPGDKFYIITLQDGTQLGSAYPKGNGYRLSRWMRKHKKELED